MIATLPQMQQHASEAEPAWKNPCLRLALALAFVFHGALLFSGSYKRTYDAYVHIFFADHYRRSWFDTWDQRWYTGFSVTSYPPGAQQSIALVSHLVGLLNGFAVVQLAALLLAVIGIYRFSRLWVSAEAAGYAALLAVFSSSIAETVHVFGQLPTIFALAFLLNALPYLSNWLKTGAPGALLIAFACFAATTAAHHVTTIFGGVFFAGPVLIDAARAVAARRRLNNPLAEPPFASGTRRAAVMYEFRLLAPAILRMVVAGFGLVVILVAVIYPYWRWSSDDPIAQLSIPHASRDSYIGNINAGLIFWLVPWGFLLIALPLALYRGLTTRLWPLVASLGLLTLLGTGGTTPIPKLVLGPAYDILTLDRFTFWATIVGLPFAGQFVVSIRRGFVRRWLDVQFGEHGRQGIQAVLVVAYLGATIFTVNLTHFRQFQPAEVDMDPILSFIEKDQHWRWRYIALGFGDQLAWLSAQTTAMTPDGDYHSARRLPELTSSPIERLEGAKYSGIPGLGSLQQFLAVPEKYSIKYVFSNDQFYDPLLYFSGWHQISRLENGIVVWQRDDVDPLPAQLPRQDISRVERLLWGTLPMASIITALALLSSSLWWPSFVRLLDRQGVRRPRIPLPGRARIGAVAARLDTWLEAQSAVPRPSKAHRPIWQKVSNLVPGVPGNMQRSRVLNLVLVGVAVASLLGVASFAALKPEPSPANVVLSYYNHLDFREYDAAYAMLDPETRPALDEYLLQLSVEGGLMASYARLDSIAAETTAISDGVATVTADVTWVTSLGANPSLDSLTLHKRGSNWYIDLPPSETVPPSDEFFSQPDVDFQSQGRREVTTGTTNPNDVLDRPELAVRSASMVAHGDIHSVVGELVNIDDVPADVTVTAVVYDANGRELTRYNAQTVMMHTLLPKETTPFRIDFEGVAGGFEAGTDTPITFEPGARYPVDPSVWAEASSFQLIVKAVVTPYDLDRRVNAQGLEFTSDESGAQLSGTLVNTGITEAVVPHLLVTYYDTDGGVAWVDELFLDTSIRSQRSEPFTLEVTPPASLQPLMPLGSLLVNGLPADLAATGSPEIFPLGSTSGFAGFRVSINYFTGSTV